ncbi:hypothetical protein CEXT_231061 [Caerostris extrusa]|uniref:Uncharacterized protein n=1 Tax=Caerostris extrusa TaxID=172846 RepID=A0AAV4RY53_CAEEX|nr:hypothetical protein CEXT_231061 [Caerostris extrusa]
MDSGRLLFSRFGLLVLFFALSSAGKLVPPRFKENNPKYLEIPVGQRCKLRCPALGKPPAPSRLVQVRQRILGGPLQRYLWRRIPHQQGSSAHRQLHGGGRRGIPLHAHQLPGHRLGQLHRQDSRALP